MPRGTSIPPESGRPGDCSGRISRSSAGSPFAPSFSWGIGDNRKQEPASAGLPGLDSSVSRGSLKTFREARLKPALYELTCFGTRTVRKLIRVS